MLVTSRETRRWIIPKGWPQKGKAPHHSAAREAYEEAGVVGATARRPLGSFEYEKRVKHGRLVICEVYVFPLKVKRQNKKWPERWEREVKWVSASRAANWIKEPMLRTIIRRLARNIRPDSKLKTHGRRERNRGEMMRAVLIMLGLILITGTAMADRPVTQEESEQLLAALKEQGCSGGKMEVDDDTFEVERARCADGKMYDLDFDSSFRLIKKKLKSGQAGGGPGGKAVPKLVLFMVIDGFPQEQFVKYYDQHSERGFKLEQRRAAYRRATRRRRCGRARSRMAAAT